MTDTVRLHSDLWAGRGLIWSFAQRDLRSRFKGTVLGWLWSLVVPLATLLIYTIVFSVILNQRPPALGNGREGNFTLYLFAGLAVWGVFSNAVNMGILSLIATGPLLKKIYFPCYAPVLGGVIAVSVQSAIEFGVLILIMLLLGNFSWTLLLVLPWAVLFAAFVAGVAHAVAVLNVYFRDLQHIVAVALQLLFYLTPIIYSVAILPQSWNGIPLRRLITLNPLAEYVEAFRLAVYELAPPTLGQWAAMTIWSVLAVSAAVLVHRRKGLDLSEEL
ncbi:MAG: ABC transporter permease [Candidatus Phosphoribacter baldrii]